MIDGAVEELGHATLSERVSRCQRAVELRLIAHC